MQSGCMTKTLEAERWLKGTDLHEITLLQRQQEQGDARALPIRGLGSQKGVTHEESVKAWLPPRRSIPF
jgi:hypothetical protein